MNTKNHISREISIKYFDNIKISIKWKFFIKFCLFMYVESVSLTLIFGHPITTSSSGPLNCFHSSEVTFIYDCPLKWTGNLVHWLFLCVGKAKQTFQIMDFTLSLDINESKEMLPAKTKQEPRKSLSSLRNEKRMNLASINHSSIFQELHTYIQLIIWELMRGKNYVICVF